MILFATQPHLLFYLKRAARQFAREFATCGSVQYVLESKPANGVRLLQLNRPKALNALSNSLIKEMNQALVRAENDTSVKCILITGSGRAFAAGADIKEMRSLTVSDAFGQNDIAKWSEITRIRKPTIAAVNGFALGGGCELAMMCDILYAAESAVFGQPEIKLGIIPGAGGTQRLTRALGKAKAMDIILTGKNFNAREAYEWGLAARVLPDEQLLPEAVKAASKIASYSGIAVMAAKESVNEAFETSLSSGVKFERRLFHMLFGTHDQKEGMAAFEDKREPFFRNE